MRRILPSLAAILTLLLSLSQGWSQDLLFDPEDEEEIDSSDYIIDEDDVDVIDSSSELPVVTGLVVPNENLDSRTAELLSDLLVDELGTIDIVTVVDNIDLRDEFEIMGSELATECAFDPVCLGRIGWDIGLDQVVIGRSTPSRTESDVTFTLDLIDLESRSVLRYRSVEVDNNLTAIGQVISRQLPFLFEIREGPTDVVDGPTGPSPVQVGMAWTTLGLGVVSLGVGVYFGIDASNLEDEVRNGDLREGDVYIAYIATQRGAQSTLDEAADSALLANVFLGTGVALLGVSALLFLITPGSDIDTQAETMSQRRIEPPVFSPTVVSGGWGVSGQMEF